MGSVALRHLDRRETLGELGVKKWQSPNITPQKMAFNMDFP